MEITPKMISYDESDQDTTMEITLKMIKLWEIKQEYQSRDYI